MRKGLNPDQADYSIAFESLHFHLHLSIASAQFESENI